MRPIQILVQGVTKAFRGKKGVRQECMLGPRFLNPPKNGIKLLQKLVKMVGFFTTVLIFVSF